HKVINTVKNKIASEIYEPSSSLYCSKWFTEFKKDGLICIVVHDLQPLNIVIICNSEIPLLIKQLADTFSRQVCYEVFSLFIIFDQHLLSVGSRNLTIFQTLLGIFWLTMLLIE
ncbi:uncharacterized protein BT62DRAFT_891143, partial [Guyanagaster necrorhizus]